MKKRLLSTLLTLCMVLAFFPITAQAADVNYPVIGGNIYFDLITGAITYCDKSVTEAVIPHEIYGVPVTSIRLQAFDSCRNLTSVTIPDSVTTIGHKAFNQCVNLTSVTIPNSVTIIDADAFHGCTGLTSVTIPGSVARMGNFIFSGCRSLTDVTILRGVTQIGKYAFSDCDNLISVTIPGSVDSIEQYMFSGCSSLTNVTMFEGTTRIESQAFQACGNLTRVALPSSITSIADGAFADCGNLTDVYFSGTIQQWAEISVSTANNNPLLGANLHFDSTMPSVPSTPSSPAAVAYPSTQTVDLDGKKIEFQMYALRDTNGNPTNYVKVRDLAMALNGTAAQFSVNWDGAVNLTVGSAYTPNGSENSTPFSGTRSYKTSTSPTNVNGASIDFQAIVLTDNNGGGYTYYQLRDLGRRLGFNVGWSAEKGVFIETGKPYSGT